MSTVVSGRFLIAELSTIKREHSENICKNGHVRPYNSSDKFCGQCGNQYEKQDALADGEMEFYELEHVVENPEDPYFRSMFDFWATNLVESIDTCSEVETPHPAENNKVIFILRTDFSMDVDDDCVLLNKDMPRLPSVLDSQLDWLIETMKFTNYTFFEGVINFSY